MKIELVEATCNTRANVGNSVVILDPNFYDSYMALDYYSVNLKLQVHAENLPRDTEILQVKLRVKLRSNVQDYTLKIPVEDAGSNQTLSTLLVVLGSAIVFAVIGYLCYLNRRKTTRHHEEHMIEMRS